MSTTSIDVNYKRLKSYQGWLKFVAILGYISSGFLILAGLVLVFTIVIPFIYWAIAGFTIWYSMKIWKAAQNLEDISEENYIEQSYQALDSLGVYFKIQGILTIVSIGLGIIALFFALLTGGFAMLRDAGQWNLDELRNNSRIN